MKLARPDIFHPRIMLAEDAQSVGDGGDDAGLVDALRRRGLHAHRLPWSDPDVLGADLVVLRATRDALARTEGLLAWAPRVSNLLNPPDVLAWNADRRYLRDLERAGVATLSRYADDEATALIFFGGGRSYAFGAAGTDPDFELWDLGRTGLRAAAEHLSVRIDELLYARVDVVGGPGDAHLVGLDLVAPELGWSRLGAAERDGGQRQFALAIESALQRLGLGPLSHRGP